MNCLLVSIVGIGLAVTACSCKSSPVLDGGQCRSSEATSHGCEVVDGGSIQDGGIGVYRMFERYLGAQLVDINEAGDVLVVYWQGSRRARLHPGCTEDFIELGPKWSFSDARSINKAGSILLRGSLPGSTFIVLHRDGGVTSLENDPDPLQTVDATHLAGDGTVVGNRIWDAEGAIQVPSFRFKGVRYLRSNGSIFILEASADGGATSYWVWDSDAGVLSALEKGQAPAAIVTNISEGQITGGLDYGDSATSAVWETHGRLKITGRNGVVLYSDAIRQLIAEAELRPNGIARRTLLFEADGGRELSFQGQAVQALVSRSNGAFAAYCLDGGYICCSSVELLGQGGP